MRPHYLIPLFLILAMHVRGQVYFDSLYGEQENGEGIGTGGTVLTPQGFLSLCFSYGNLQPMVLATDASGTEQWSIYEDDVDSVERLTLNLITKNDSIYYGLTSWADLDQVDSVRGDFGLIKFSSDGSVIYSGFLGQSNRRESPQRMMMTANSNIALIGQAIIGTGENEQGDMYLIKADTSGNQIWAMTYGGTGYDSGKDLIQTPDSGFLLLGWTRSYGAGQRDFYLVKTNSLGNQQWQRTYGGTGEEVASSIMQLSDGNYLLTGSGSQGTQSGSGSLGRVYKIEPDGTLIWSKTYIHESNSGNNLHKTIELWNGDLVSAGMTDNNSNAGYLIRTDSLGEVIWQREYNKNSGTDLFYSVLLANDGGFLLSGQAMNAQTGSQDAWLLKVDSVGCPYANCLVGVDEVEKGRVVVDVWPNPAGEYVRLQVTGNSKQHEMRITVTDMQGRSYSPPAQKGTGVVGTYLEVDVRGWPNGLYIFTVENGNERARVRVVVQH